MKRSWYCDQCHVEVYERRCPHCGKLERDPRGAVTKQQIDAAWKAFDAWGSYSEDGDRMQAALEAAAAVRPAADGVAAERERCAQIAEYWLTTFSHHQPNFISGRQWATDAVKDIAEAIRNGTTLKSASSK